MDFHMENTMRRTYQIEIKVEFNDEAKYEIVREALREAARTVYSTAVLIADGRLPAVAIMSDDFFEGTEQITITSDESDAA
jgi:hypothetical protein